MQIAKVCTHPVPLLPCREEKQDWQSKYRSFFECQYPTHTDFFPLVMYSFLRKQIETETQPLNARLYLHLMWDGVLEP